MPASAATEPEPAFEPIACGWWHFPARVRFGLASTRYEPNRQSDGDLIDEIAEFLAGPTIRAVRVEGHRSGECRIETDRHAEERAQEVERMLIERGVEPARISWNRQNRGIGSPPYPMCDPDSAEPHPQRVVEFSIYACRDESGPVRVHEPTRAACSADGSASVPCSGARR
ncbi:MAG: OmpA family protein [Sandaracinaceae bacterium]